MKQSIRIADYRHRATAGRLLLGCYFPRSVKTEGVGTLVRSFAEEMQARHWDVEVLVPQTIAMDANIRQHAYRPGPAGLWRYARAIAQHSADADAVMLIENNPNLGWLTNASKTRGRTLIYFNTPLQHLGLLQETGATRQGLVHLAAKHHWFSQQQDWSSRHCVVASEFQARQLRSVGATQVRVLPGGGVSRRTPHPTRSEARRAFGWDNRPVVGYLGHHSPAKGVHTLIEAMSACATQPILAMAYSGKGRLPETAHDGLAFLNTRGRFRPYGLVDPREFLAACDVVVLPFATSSIQHPPLVLIESYAAATAVITTCVGGIPEMVIPGRTGQLVSPRNASQLAETIDQCIANPNQLHEMGQRARNHFEQYLAQEVVGEQLDSLLLEHCLPLNTRAAA